MWYKVVKWIAWVISIIVLIYVGTGILMFYHVCTTTVYTTPWGDVDMDTAKIGFMEPWSHEPCYEAHREVSDFDTIRYYFFKSRAIYYKADHDSADNLRIRLYYPNNTWKKDGEVCTEYFRKEDIFIR